MARTRIYTSPLERNYEPSTDSAMKVVSRTERYIEYADGLAVKIVFHAILLGLALWLLLCAPSEGVLTFTNGQAELVRTSLAGIIVERQSFASGCLVEARIQRARHRPGDGPPTLSSRVELLICDGTVVALTHAYGHRRAEMAIKARQINQYLAEPHGTLKISQNYNRPLALPAVIVGVYALFALLWGIHETRVQVDRDHNRLSLIKRRILVRQARDWPLSWISYLALEETRSSSDKMRRVRPIMVLPDGSTEPLLSARSAVFEGELRTMLENLGRVANLPVR